MELSSPKIKNFLIFSQKKFFMYFWEMELSSPKLKKLSHIFLKKCFLHFRRELAKPGKQKNPL